MGITEVSKLSFRDKIGGPVQEADYWKLLVRKN